MLNDLVPEPVPLRSATTSPGSEIEGQDDLPFELTQGVIGQSTALIEESEFRVSGSAAHGQLAPGFCAQTQQSEAGEYGMTKSLHYSWELRQLN